MPRRAKKPAASSTVEQVHETHENVAAITLTPGHPPRRETAEFEETRHFLIEVKGQGCDVCQVTHADIQSGDPKRNPLGAKFLEAHHDPIEWSLADAVDPVKVHAVFPQVFNRRTLEQFVDSPSNMRILCDVHHTSTEHGIHHVLYPDWIAQKFLLDGYEVAARPQDAAAALAHDEQIERAAGIEQAVDAQMAGPDPQTAGTGANNVAASSAAPSAAPARPAASRARSRRPATSAPTSRRRLPTPAAAPAQGVA